MQSGKIFKGAGVAGILFNEKNELLLIKRRDVPIWVLPGGGLDAGETPEQAIVREFLEETHISVKSKRLVAEYLPTALFSRHTFVFDCEKISGSPRSGAEAKDIGFFSLAKLPDIFFPLHHEWVKQALKNEPFVISKTEGLSLSKLFQYALSHPLLTFRFLLSRLGLPFNN